MSTTDIAQKLLIGSKEIDRMKEEIKSVLGMVVGLVADGDVVAWKRGLSMGSMGKKGDAFSSPNCEWFIMPHAEYEYAFYVEYWTKKLGDIPRTRDCVFFSGPHSDLVVVSCKTRKVHAGLSVFVEGMVKIFPELEGKLRPFLEAADNALKE